MKIKLYINKADNRIVDKTKYLTEIFSFDFVQLKNDTSIMTPTLIFQLANSTQIETISKSNYLYIEDLNIYYYIKDKQFLSGNRVLLQCVEDVLHTYRIDIYTLDCVCERQENNFNAYLDDPLYKVYNFRRIQTLEFPHGFDKNNCQYILAIAGGGE